MIDLGRIPHTRPHLLADAIEISIAYGGYTTMSMTDAVGLINTSPRDDTELLPIDEEDTDDNEYPDDMGGAEISAKEQSRVEEAFRQLEYRANTLGDEYPFKIERETLTIKSDLTDLNLVYLMLLACSRTRTFKHRGAVQKIADCFEEICAQCLEKMISPFGRAIMFGPNSPSRKTEFPGGVQNALPLLTKAMGMNLKKGWGRNFPSASGDAKIDLVGIYDFNDTAEGFKVVIGQCASMEDEKNWERKRQEAQLKSRSGSFDFLVEPDAVLFIPVCYRQPDGSWVNSDHVSAVVTVDRIRIMKILARKDEIGFDVDALFKKAGIRIAA